METVAELFRSYLTKFRAFLSCSGPSSGGGVMDLERVRGRFKFLEGDLDCAGGTGSSSESLIYSTSVAPLSKWDLTLRVHC